MMAVHRYYFVTIYIQIETIWKRKKKEKPKHKNNRNYYLLYSTIIKLLLFLTMPIFVETVSLIRTCITVCLVVFLVVDILKDIRIRFIFLCCKP